MADSARQRFAMADREVGRIEGDVIEKNVATAIDGAEGRTGEEYRNECDLWDCQKVARMRAQAKRRPAFPQAGYRIGDSGDCPPEGVGGMPGYYEIFGAR